MGVEETIRTTQSDLPAAAFPWLSIAILLGVLAIVALMIAFIVSTLKKRTRHERTVRSSTAGAPSGSLSQSARSSQNAVAARSGWKIALPSLVIAASVGFGVWASMFGGFERMGIDEDSAGISSLIDFLPGNAKTDDEEPDDEEPEDDTTEDESDLSSKPDGDSVAKSDFLSGNVYVSEGYSSDSMYVEGQAFYFENGKVYAGLPGDSKAEIKKDSSLFTPYEMSYSLDGNTITITSGGNSAQWAYNESQDTITAGGTVLERD
jgi:hypothetical protein